ncbi:hypothetical protein Scep_014296 [Stephania cephalantha]|uniref:DNA-directed RNA polymerase N-terminal domain-containing protein n=1 Tax=Stephania cephalantha TaxID=152367 RepID=A0AAP0J1R2_9MAGN
MNFKILNRHLSSIMFRNKDCLEPLLDFLRAHKHKGHVRIHKFLERAKRSRRLKTIDNDEHQYISEEGEIQRKQVEKLIKHKKLRKVQKMLKNGKDTSWGRDPQAKLGSCLIKLLIESAYVQPPVSQLSDCQPEIRPAFSHRVKTILKEPGKRGGAKKCRFIECDPLVQKGLHSINHRARTRTRPSSTLTRTRSHLLELIRHRHRRIDRFVILPQLCCPHLHRLIDCLIALARSIAEPISTWSRLHGTLTSQYAINNNSSSSDSGNKSKLALAVALPTGLSVLCISTIAGCFIWRRKRTQEGNNDTSQDLLQFDFSTKPTSNKNEQSHINKNSTGGIWDADLPLTIMELFSLLCFDCFRSLRLHLLFGV